MDTISQYSARNFYSAVNTAAANQAGTNTASVKHMQADEFLKLVREQGAKAPDQSRFLYDGSETRATLSETEIAVLANKYDPQNMDQETYDAFLDDLQSMGVISDMEKRQMSYQGFQMIGYMGDDRNPVPGGSTSAVWRLPEESDGRECLIAPWHEDRNIDHWLGERTRKELTDVFDPSSWGQAKGYENLLKSVYNVLERVQARREENGTAAEEAEAVSQTAGKNPDLYNGSATRKNLSSTEIAVLADKYDVHNMSDADFDDFLDDLESMGALSPTEKEQLGYRGSVTVGYFRDGKLEYTGSSGAWVSPMIPGGSKLLFNRWEANGDVSRWINERIRWERSGFSSDPAQRKVEEDYENLHKILANIINRVGAQQKSSAEDAEKAELVRQLADKNSEFYTNMRTTLKAQVDKTKEDEEEQAIIDALGKVLDALSGKEEVLGKKASVNKSASELTQKIGERVSRLKREDPENPEIVKLENMLKRLQEMGIYVDLSDMDDLWQDDSEVFETLTQYLNRLEAEKTETKHPDEQEVNESA